MKTWKVTKSKGDEDELELALQQLENAGQTIFAIVGGTEKTRLVFKIASYTES